MIESIAHEINEAGPACLAPKAGRKNIPVPIMELIVMRRITLKLSTFFSSVMVGIWHYWYIKCSVSVMDWLKRKKKKIFGTVIFEFDNS